jgi:hypothetical protein
MKKIGFVVGMAVVVFLVVAGELAFIVGSVGSERGFADNTPVPKCLSGRKCF